MPLLLCLTSNQALKKIPIEVSNVILCLFTAIMLPNLIVVVKKDLRNKFPVVVSRRDNVKTKEISQTFISEDLSWDIVLSHNRYILSQ